MGNEPSMEQHSFNLKMMSKQLAKQASKSESNANAAKRRCKIAMEKGNMDGARIHAESAIREKNQATMFLRLSGRLSAVQQRVENAIRMRNVTRSMKGIVHGMDEIMSCGMDVVKMSAVLDKFEQQFQDLDILDKSMSRAFDSTLATTTPETEVESLMSQVADEHGLEFQTELDGMGTVRKKQASTVTTGADSSKQKIAVGAPTNNKKKGDDDDDKDEGSGGGAGGGAGGAPSGTSDDDLEARLRRLQGF